MILPGETGIQGDVIDAVRRGIKDHVPSGSFAIDVVGVTVFE
jgi:hypothetical protein